MSLLLTMLLVAILFSIMVAVMAADEVRSLRHRMGRLDDRVRRLEEMEAARGPVVPEQSRRVVS